jgi:hypothetical protein
MVVHGSSEMSTHWTGWYMDPVRCQHTEQGGAWLQWDVNTLNRVLHGSSEMTTHWTGWYMAPVRCQHTEQGGTWFQWDVNTLNRVVHGSSEMSTHWTGWYMAPVRGQHTEHGFSEMSTNWTGWYMAPVRCQHIEQGGTWLQWDVNILNMVVHGSSEVSTHWTGSCMTVPKTMQLQALPLASCSLPTAHPHFQTTACTYNSNAAIYLCNFHCRCKVQCFHPTETAATKHAVLVPVAVLTHYNATQDVATIMNYET